MGVQSYNDAILRMVPGDIAPVICGHLPAVGELERLIGPLRGWHQWMTSQGHTLDHLIGPDIEAITARADIAAGMGKQRGSEGTTVGIARVVPLYQGKEWHIHHVCNISHPFQSTPRLESDLQFAVDESMSHGPELAEARISWTSALVSLGASLVVADVRARSVQTKRANQVAGQMSLLLMAVMSIFCMWPHQTVVQQFTYGYDIMGATTPTGVFRPHLKPAVVSEADLLSTASQWHDEIWNSPCPINAADIYEQTMQEVDRNLAGPLRPRSYWDRIFGPNGWRGCIRFAIWQGSKLRCIDDGKRSLHNLGQEIYEKIHHCSAEFGGTIAVYAARQVAGPWPEWMQVHMGTDDLNEAYRGCPTSEASARWSIVLVFDVIANAWAGSMMYGYSYGFRSSVNNFNAWPELQVAFSRRALRVPTSHYVDDFPIADFISGGSTAQDSLHTLFDVTGTGWSEQKAQPLASAQSSLARSATSTI